MSVLLFAYVCMLTAFQDIFLVKQECECECADWSTSHMLTTLQACSTLTHPYWWCWPHCRLAQPWPIPTDDADHTAGLLNLDPSLLMMTISWPVWGFAAVHQNLYRALCVILQTKDDFFHTHSATRKKENTETAYSVDRHHNNSFIDRHCSNTIIYTDTAIILFCRQTLQQHSSVTL